MKSEDQIQFIIDNFDFQRIIKYLRIVENKELPSDFTAEFLKEKARKMLDRAWKHREDVEAYNMTALRKGDFLELVFTPMRTNVLRKFFN